MSMSKLALKVGKPNLGPPKPVKKTSAKPPPFEVREGTFAVCRFMMADMAGAILFHAIVELWVETKKKVVRGGYEWLFLSGDQLVKLSGLTKYELRDRAVPRLKACSFFEIKTGRITRESPNVYQIRFDQDAFWEEVAAVLDPTKEIKTKEHGHVWVTKMVDPSKLPYLFKRLYHAVAEGT